MHLRAGTCNFKSDSSLLFQPAVFIRSELSHARAERQSLRGVRVRQQHDGAIFRDPQHTKPFEHAPQAHGFVIA